MTVLHEHSAEIDLALIDSSLPGMGGEDVAAALHQIDGALPCCLMTGDAAAPLPSGFCCALAKPFLPIEVTALLAGCTRGP